MFPRTFSDPSLVTGAVASPPPPDKSHHEAACSCSCVRKSGAEAEYKAKAEGQATFRRGKIAETLDRRACFRSGERHNTECEGGDDE
uniref:Uncharacterized protein n=1 Tax=Steinernema glaseri TaxID=37863 RepID=A0A1I8ACN8_9BILA